MSDLTTNFNISPYFDDYDNTKNFHRILFRPSVPVQARELTQLQTIIQEQIRRFGDHIFKDGSVVAGCAFSFDPNYLFIRIKDTYANNSAYTIADFNNLFIENANGLKARIINTVEGLESSYPDTPTLYVKYENTSDTDEKIFQASQQLRVFTSANVSVGNVTVMSTNATVTAVSGTGYGFSTTEGVIYQKGYFIRVEPQTVIVSKYTNTPDDLSIGFTTDENIITPEIDTSLLDNAAGAPNFAAPGAHRIKLVSSLNVRTTSNIATSDAFFSLADFKGGLPVSIKFDAQYAALSREFAKRTYEESGNYVVTAFILSPESIPSNTTHFSVGISKGVGYIEGYRVEIINKFLTPTRKATDKKTVTNNIISTNFGNYLNIDEYAGDFNTENLIQIELHNTAYNALTNRTFLGTSTSAGNKIGYAYAKAVKYGSGTPGTPAAIYQLYIFNIDMDTGYDFADVQSIRYFSGSLLAVADVVLEGGFAILQEPTGVSLIYPLGQQAVSINDFTETQFEYTNRISFQFSTGGANSGITLPAVSGTGTENFAYSGSLSDASDEDFIVITTASANSTAKTGTANTNNNTTITGASTTYTSDYKVGDYIYVNSDLRRITNIANNTLMTVDSAVSGSSTGLAHRKHFPNGYLIPIATRTDRTISIAGSTATINLGESLASSLNAVLYHRIVRSDTVAIKKDINKNTIVKINCSTHPARNIGPWSLGLPDIQKINAIYVSSNGSYSTSGTNYISKFEIDDGQLSSHYGLASISLSAGLSLKPNDTILIDLNCFTQDTSQGVGFFSANSYPVDDANTANTTAIQTAEIPAIFLDDFTVNLRDCIDFRPYASNTALPAANSSTATINPSNTIAFAVSGAGSYMPSPDSQFKTDLKYYMSRVDKVQISTTGEVFISEGKPSLKPVEPRDQPGSMALGTILIPPYPSITPVENLTYKLPEYTISTKLTQQRRYTMRDIGGIDQRLKNVEYLTSLNLLEKKTTDLQVKNDQGLDRFKSGFLVDPFTGHDVGATTDKQYFVSIDRSTTEMRPAISRLTFGLDGAYYSNASITGQIATLNYTEVSYVNQRLASKLRNCIEGNLYEHIGQLKLTPDTDTTPDFTKGADVKSNLDLYSNFAEMADLSWFTEWGDWTNVGKAVTTVADKKTIRTTRNNRKGDLTTWNEITTQEQQRIGKDLNAIRDTESVTIGEFVTDISIQEYIQPNTIRFVATGMKPNTRVYPFFNNENVSTFCRPLAGYSKTSGVFTTIIGLYGDSLYTNASGKIEGDFSIRAGRYKSDEIKFKLLDIDDIIVGADVITTSAEATYFGSKLSYHTASAQMNVQVPQFYVQTTKDSNTAISTVPKELWDPDPPPPPPPPPPSTGGGGGGTGNDSTGDFQSTGSSTGGHCKIVCTAMNDSYGFGSFRNAIWLKYAAEHLTKYHEAGYHAIFLPLVERAYKRSDNNILWLRSVLEHIARHRTTDIRQELRNGKRDTLGRTYRAVLEPICYAVGWVKCNIFNK